MPVITIRDIELHYELHGERGPCIVLIHGLGSSLRDWEHQIGPLAARYRVLAVDLRGHGRSSRRGPISVATFARDVSALIAALALPPVYPVGISMGSAVAFQLALDHPDQVAGLIVINGGPEGPSTANPVHRQEIEWRVSAVRTQGMRGIGELLAARLLPAPSHAQARATFVERWAENDPEMYVASLEAMVDWTVRDRIGTIARPCGVISGDRDYTPVDFKRAYTGELRDAELVVLADSGHMSTHDQPAALTDAIVGFVERWAAL